MPIKWGEKTKQQQKTDKMDKFFERYNVQDSTLKKQKIWRVCLQVLKLKVIKKFTTNKGQEPNDLTCKFDQTLREQLMPIFPKLFQNITKEGKLWNSFYETNITFITIPERDHRKIKLQVNINDEYRFSNTQQNTSKPNWTIH